MKEKLIKININLIIKILFILISIVFVVPSILYLIKNGTILGFKNYYNFFIDDGKNKVLSTMIYLIVFLSLSAIYLYFIKKKDSFKNIKQLLIYVAGVSIIFIAMIPWHSSDIFYYMGVGELNSVYGQNPYYETIKEYETKNPEVIEEDTIMKQGYINYWSNTTVVYGPIAQLVFSSITKISFKNLDFCMFLFKLLNIIVHILNCYLIYKITKKLKFSIIYGLNPYILMEFFGMVHNDIIVVFLVLLSLYFLLKKKQILPSVIFLALATGIKYFTLLLLPIIILYYYKDEENILKRILRCIQYGLIFIVIIMLEYLIYFRDNTIFTAMMVQTDRYCKSFYAGLYSIALKNKKVGYNVFGKTYLIGEICKFTRNIMFAIFAIIYIKFCIDLLLSKEIKIQKTFRKYSFCLLLFIMSLSNFQQWYLLWLFATIPWQKPNSIRDIIGLSLASEIGNTIYMFKVESYKYDAHFVFIIAMLFIIWKICTNKRRFSIDMKSLK